MKFRLFIPHKPDSILIVNLAFHASIDPFDIVFGAVTRAFRLSMILRPYSLEIYIINLVTAFKG